MIADGQCQCVSSYLSFFTKVFKHTWMHPLMFPHIWILLGIIVFFVVSALPLYLAVKLLGGKTSILRTILVMIISGFLVSLSHSLGGVFGGLIAFIVVLWLYRVSFELGWIRALVVWAAQFVIMVFLYLLMVMMFGSMILGSFLLWHPTFECVRSTYEYFLILLKKNFLLFYPHMTVWR